MVLSRRQVLRGAAGIAVSALLPGIARAGETRTIGGHAFASYWRASLPAGAEPEPARAAVESVIAAIDRALSPYRAESELSRFNAARTTGWTRIGPDSARVFAEGLRIARLTGGAFDPTVGPLVARLGFGPITGRAEGSYRGLIARAGAVRKTDPGLTFDPCGIAKGFALDRAAAALDALGLGAYLLEIGGEVFARGRHPSGRPWQVGIERPLPGAAALQRIVRLEGLSLATSGDWINGYEIAGRRFGHIIDPARGTPADTGVASVSVIARRGMAADALATALMAMGPERGLRFAARLDLPVLYLLRRGGGIEEAPSPRFGAYLVT